MFPTLVIVSSRSLNADTAGPEATVLDAMGEPESASERIGALGCVQGDEPQRERKKRGGGRDYLSRFSVSRLMFDRDIVACDVAGARSKIVRQYLLRLAHPRFIE